MGQVRNISTQTTNVTYKLDDGTAIIEVKQWNNPDSLDSLEGPKAPGKSPVEGDYAQVWGRMKAFNNKRTVVAHVIRTIVDFNAIQCHLLEAAVVHLFFARGPPPPKGMSQMQMQNQSTMARGQGMMPPPGGSMGGGAGGDFSGNMNRGAQFGSPLLISDNAKDVLNVLRTVPQNNEGLHAQQIAARLGMNLTDVMKAGDELQSSSLIFSTVDDETWAPLEA